MELPKGMHCRQGQKSDGVEPLSGYGPDKSPKIHRELEQDGKPITADILKRRYYGEGDSPKMLLEVFREHNRKYRELMGKDYVAGTVLRYERTARYLEELLQKNTE